MSDDGPFWCGQADTNDVWHAVLGDFEPPAGDGAQRSCDHHLLAGRHYTLRFPTCIVCQVVKSQMRRFGKLGARSHDPVLELHLSGASKEEVQQLQSRLMAEAEDELFLKRMEEEGYTPVLGARACDEGIDLDDV